MCPALFSRNAQCQGLLEAFCIDLFSFLYPSFVVCVLKAFKMATLLGTTWQSEVSCFVCPSRRDSKLGAFLEIELKSLQVNQWGAHAIGNVKYLLAYTFPLPHPI